MPSGPKKRRAARRKRGGTNAAGEEDEFDGAGNNVSEMSFGDVKPDVVNEKGAKKSEPVVQIALESPPTVESEHVEKIKDVPVLDESVSVGSKAKESEHESVHDDIVVHAPVTESVITVMESSDAVGKKEKESDSEQVDQILIQSDSKETKGDGYGEVGEGVVCGPMEIVDHGFSVVKDGEEMSKEVVLQDSFQEPGVSASDEPQAITTDTVDQSVSEVNSERFIEEAQDSLKKPSEVDVSPDHEGVEKECVEVGESAGNDSKAMVRDVVSVMNKGVEVSMEGVLEERLEEPIERSSDDIQAIEMKTLDQSNLKAIPFKEDHDSSIPDESVSESNVETSLRDGQDSLVDVFPVEDVQRNERVEVSESKDHGPPAMLDDDVSVAKESEEMSIEGPLEEKSESFSHEPQEMLKTVDELVLKKIRVKEAQDTSVQVESVIEVDVETKSIQDDQESFATPLGSPMSPIESDVHLNGLWNESIEHSLHEPHLIPLSETQDTSLPVESSVNEVHIQEPLEDPQDSFREPPTVSSSLVDVSHVEGIVQESEAGDNASQESEGISHDKPQLIPSSETQDTSLLVDSVNEVHIQTPLEDPQDSIKEQPVISSLPVDVSHVEGIVQESEDGESESASHDKPELIPSSETQDTSLPVESVNEVHIQTPLEDPQDSIKEPPAICSSLVDVSHVEVIVQESEVGESASQESESASHGEPQFTHLSEAQDTSLPVESVNDIHIQIPLEDPQDSFTEPPLISSSLVDVSHVKGIVQGSEVGETASHNEPHLIHLSETQDTSLSVESLNEVHIQTPTEDLEDSIKVSSSLVDVSHVEVAVQESEVGERGIHDESVFKEGGKVSMEGVIEESFKEPTKLSTNELQETMKTGHHSFLDDEDPFVLVALSPEENVETSLIVTQDTLKKPLRESYMDDLSLVEGVVQGEVGESICQDQPTMVNHVESVLEDHEEVSIKGVLEEPQTMVKTVTSECGDSSKEPLESPSLSEVTFVSRNVNCNGYGAESTEGSSHGPHVMVNTTDDLVVPKEIDFEKAQNPSLRADLIEENGETSLNEDQDSFKEISGDSSTDDVSFMDHGQPAMVLNHVESAMKKDEEISMESVLEEPLEELLGSSSHEPSQTDDKLVLKAITLDGTQGPSILADSVIEVNDRAYLKDDQGSSIQTGVSRVEGVVEGNKCVVGECTCDCALINHVVSEGQKIPLEGVHQDPFKVTNGDSSHEPQETVDTIDQPVMKTTLLKETQDPYVPVELVNEVVVETSSKDGHHSLKELLESRSLEETSTIEGFVQLNVDKNEQIGQSSHEKQGDATYVEGVVSENESDEEIPIEAVLEKHIEELNGRSSDELESIVRALDEAVAKEMPLEEDKDPFIPSDSVSEANVETISLKDVQEYSFKVPQVSSFLVNVPPVKGNEYDEVGESTTLVNPFVLGIEEDDDMSIEGDLEEDFKELDISSSYEPQEILKEVDQSVLKDLSLTKVQDPSIPVDSIKEVNVDSSFKEAQDSTKDLLDNLSLAEDQIQAMDKSTNDLKEMPLKEAQDDSLSGESVSEENVETLLKDDQDSLKVTVYPIEGICQGKEYDEGGENGAIVTFVESILTANEDMSREGVLEEPLEELIGSSLDDSDQSTLKEARDPSLPVEAVIEVNEEISFKDDQDSLKVKLENPSLGDVSFDHIGESACHGSPATVKHIVSDFKEDGAMSMEGVLEDVFEYPTRNSLLEAQAMVDTDDELVPNDLHLKEAQDPFVPADFVVKVNVDTSFEDAEDSFETPLGSPSVGHVSLVEDFTEVKGDQKDQVVSKVIPMEETQEPSLPNESVNEANVETFIEDAKDHSSMESLRSFRMADMSSIEGAVLDDECAEVSETACDGPLATVNHDVSVDSGLKDEKEVSMKDVLKESLKEPNEPFLDELQTTVQDLVSGPIQEKEYTKDGEKATTVYVEALAKEIEDLSVEGVLEESFKEQAGDSSNEQVMVNTIDRSLLKQGQDPFVPGVVQEKEYGEDGENATMVNHVESLTKNIEDLSIEGVLEENLKEQVEDSSHEQEAKVNTIDRSILKEDQYPFVPGAIQEKEYTEDGANGETSIEDAEGQSSMESLRSFPMADVPSIEGFVQDNEDSECAEVGEVGETECDGPFTTVNHDVSVDSVLKGEKEVSMKDVLEESLKEPNEPFSDELQTMVKTVNQTVQDPSVPGESNYEVYLDTSLKYNQISLKEPLVSPFVVTMSPLEGAIQEKEYNEGGENATTVYHVESVAKEIKDLSIEGDLEESFKEQVGHSSHEQEAMVSSIVRSLLREIPMTEDQDPYAPIESEVNVETSFQDVQDSESIGSPSQVDVFPSEEIVQGNEFEKVNESAFHGLPVMANHVMPVVKESEGMLMEGCSLINRSSVEAIGQRNEMVGLVRTLLEEIRRIRAFYEEGLRQTTEIHLHMSQVLEKFDSDKLI